MNLDIFGDNRKIPNITVNVKVKVKDLNQDETRAWKPETAPQAIVTNK